MTTGKLADGAVTPAKIAAGAVTARHARVGRQRVMFSGIGADSRNVQTSVVDLSADLQVRNI